MGWLVFFSSRRRHTRFDCDWSSDVCSSDLIDEDVGRLVALGEHAGEQDAVVVAVGLVAEHGDLPALAAVPREQLLDEARARHPVADHHQPLLQLPPPSMRAAQTLNSGMRLTGSSAALVSRLAPSQWKETKTVSCRKNGLHSTVKRSEEHTSELQSQSNLVCRLLIE